MHDKNRSAVLGCLLIAAALTAHSVAALREAPATGTQPGMSAAMFRYLSQQLRVSAYDATIGLPPGRTTFAADAAAPAAPGSGGIDPDAPMKIKVRAQMETPGGYIATAPLPGAPDGSYAVFHGNGGVSVLSATGSMTWNVPAGSFMSRTGHPPPGAHPNSPNILLGTDPIDPFIAASDHPYAVGDLNGDGVADVAIAHFFRYSVSISGDSQSQVSVLDGRSGEYLFSRMFPGFVMSLLIDGNMLVIADCTGDHAGSPGFGQGQNGSRTSLEALRFQPHPGGVSVTPAWSYSTGAQWAPWLALEHAGAGAIAAAWTGTPVGTPGGAHGQVLRVATATGTKLWSKDTDGYPRKLRYDAARSEVVALVEDDPQASQQVGYSLLGLAVADGGIAQTLTQSNAIALAFGIGGGAWIVSALATTPNVTICPDPGACPGSSGSFYVSGGITAFDPASGQTKWTYPLSAPQTGANAVQPYAMLTGQGAAGNILIVSSFVPTTKAPLGTLDPALTHVEDSEIDAIDQDTGLRIWSKTGVNLLMPLFLSPYSHGGRQLAMGASSRWNLYGIFVSGQVTSTVAQLIQPMTPYQMVRTFDVVTGEEVQDTPLLSDVHGAIGADVNGDGVTDLIVGCESAGVFALDGRHLSDDNPVVLWRATAGGAVRKVLRADLDGDGVDEAVVVASRAINVYDTRTGHLRYELPYPNDFVWTATLDDLDGDGRPDIVVPTSKVDAYKGSTGTLLWTFTAPPSTSPNDTGRSYFSTAAATSGHDIAVEYLNVHVVPNPEDGTSENQTVVLINGANGQARWTHSFTYPGGTLELVGGAMAADGAPGVAGTAVAFVSVQTDDGTWLTSRPVIDVYDAATGVRAYTATYPYVAGNNGAAFVPGVGFESFGGSPSLLATPGGSVLNLYNMSPTEIVTASLGAYGKHSVIASFLLLVDIAKTTGFQPDGIRYVPMSAHYVAPFLNGGLAIQDLDGDGVDEIISYPWDMDGFEGASYQSGQFGLFPDPYVHGLQVLAVEQPNTAPVASFSSDVTGGDAPLAVTFTVGGTDADGDTLSYDLNFGDGSVHSTSSGSVTHGYASAGDYTATLTVSDGKGGSDVKSVAIHATTPPPPNHAPVATLTPPTATIHAGEAVSFNVGATDEDGDALTVDLDFDDGSTHGSQTGIVGHTYTTVGSYTATLKVSDGRGGVATKTTSVTVQPAAIGSLVVHLTADKSGGDVSHGPVTVTFTATVENDDGTPLQYTFAFGDGETSTITQAGNVITHDYAYAGTYHPYVTATQEYGARAATSGENEATITTTTRVTVSPIIVAKLIYDFPAGNVAPADVVFGTDGSSGESYTLEFGDGSKQDGTGAPPASITHHYAAPQAFTATLTVRDAKGSVSNSQTFTLVAKQQLTALLQVSTSEGTSPLEVIFDGCHSVPGNGHRIASFTVDFGDGTDAVTQAVDAAHVVDCSGADRSSDPSRFTHTYSVTSSKTFFPTLTVTDDVAASSFATYSTGVAVTPPAVEPPPVVETPPASGGGHHGGSFGWLTLLPLFGAALRRRTIRTR